MGEKAGRGRKMEGRGPALSDLVDMRIGGGTMLESARRSLGRWIDREWAVRDDSTF
jgi:hypothetical protein